MLYPAQIQANVAKLIGKHFTVEMDNDPKHMAKATQSFLKANKLYISQWLSHMISTQAWFSVTKLKTEGRKTCKQLAAEGSSCKDWVEYRTGMGYSVTDGEGFLKTASCLSLC